MKSLIPAILFALASGMTATNARAELILAVGDEYYIGHIDDAVPSGASQEAGYVTTLLSLDAGAAAVQIPAGTGEFYDRIGSNLDTTSFPAASGGNRSTDGPPNTGIGVNGFTYILAKYDQSKAGAYVWYIHGLTTVTLPETEGQCGSKDNPAGCGLSHYTLYNPTSSVPDSGMTLILLGGALVSLETLRRKFCV